MTGETILEVRDVTKLYPGVAALQDVSLSLRRGEVLALLGENGAGKSTLIKVLTGAISPTKGEILIDGQSFTALTPAQARRLGIGVIHQELILWPKLTVTENIFVGEEVRRAGFVDRDGMLARTRELVARLGVAIDPLALVGRLSVAYQQVVAILKALNQDVRVLIMDEPTATLTQQEVDLLFALVRRLRAQGVSIVFISHRLDEVFAIADRVTVLRDGVYVDTVDVADATRESLIALMVGRELGELIPRRRHAFGEVALEARNIRARYLAKDVSFSVREGEVLGLAGLVGSGRTETVRAVFGVDDLVQGEVLVRGKRVTMKSPRDAISRGLGLIPEDRKTQGVLLKMSVRDNVSVVSVQRISRLTFIDRRKENALAQKYVAALRIRTPSLEQSVVNLSGGNQQKIALAKWLAQESSILIFDEPTRGIDVGAKREVYEIINQAAENGAAIVMISSDMPELIGMSDRVIVLREGVVARELSGDEITQEAIVSAWS